MLSYAILFFILAVIAGVLGFGGLAGTFAGIAKFLAILFAVIFVAGLIADVLGRRRRAL